MEKQISSKTVEVAVLPMNLQMFASDVETETVETTPTETVETTEHNPVNEESLNPEQTEVVSPSEKPRQDTDTNKAFQEMRRKAQEHEDSLNRVARLAGYASHEAFLQAVAQKEEEIRIQEAAQRVGVDADTYREYFDPRDKEVNELRNTVQQLQTAELSRNVQRELAELKKDPDFSKYEEKTIELWKSNPMFETLADAYEFASYKDRLQKVQQTTEQETIRKLQQNQTTSTGSLSVGDLAHKTSINNMGKDDFNSLVEKVLRGDIKQL